MKLGQLVGIDELFAPGKAIQQGAPVNAESFNGLFR
jgi:hypothetical protein